MLQSGAPFENSQKKVTHVLVLAYMRSGSTFTGQLFNRNPDSFYWFEPVESIYTAMYGTSFGLTLPLDIAFNTNGEFRCVHLLLKIKSNVSNLKVTDYTRAITRLTKIRV